MWYDVNYYVLLAMALRTMYMIIKILNDASMLEVHLCQEPPEVFLL